MGTYKSAVILAFSLVLWLGCGEGGGGPQAGAGGDLSGAGGDGASGSGGSGGAPGAGEGGSGGSSEPDPGASDGGSEPSGGAGGTEAAGEGGAGGTGAGEGGSGGEAGTVPEVAPRANGDTCAEPTDCASGRCEQSVGGEFLCYGILQPGDLCTETVDCAGGICTPTNIDSSAMRCSEGIRACISNPDVPIECAESTAAFCGLIQACGGPVNVPAEYGDFEFCTLAECSAIDLTASQCSNITAAVFSPTATCP